MLATPDRGCLAIADISGYTAYLVGSELDHAQDVLADLNETIVGALAPPFTFAKLEGDAAFVYIIGDRIDPSVLLDTVAGCYAAFRNRVASIARATTCTCNACVLIPRLDLKAVAHHGAFVRRRIRDSEELTGADVVTVHRLLKNAVVDATGVTAYALYTQACVAAMGVDPVALGMRAHREDFEGVGQVAGWVDDLEARWTADRERRRVRIDPAAAGTLVVAGEVEAPISRVWELLTVPQLRTQWQEGVLRVDEQNAAGGIRGVGTINHCVHGSGAMLEEILDWRPFDYYTLRSNLGIPGIPPILFSFELEPITSQTTRLRFLAARPPGAARLAWPLLARELRKSIQANARRLAELLRREAEGPAPIPA